MTRGPNYVTIQRHTCRITCCRTYCTAPRTALPGKAPGCSTPLRTSTTPFTRTSRNPSGARVGCRYVARSMMVAASNRTISASAPTLSRPLRAIVGTRCSMRRAGSIVILRNASINVTTCRSRAYRPSTRANVPATRGCPTPSCRMPSLAIIVSERPFHARELLV